MTSQKSTDRYFDPPAVCASIISENYSEMPVRSIASLVDRIQRGLWYIIDKEPRRDRFFISPEIYVRDERGDELEVGLLIKRTGGAKTAPSPTEIAEGRTYYDGNKWRFHYGDELLCKLPREILIEYRDFLGACRVLNNRGRHMAIRLAEAFDVTNKRMPQYPGLLAERMKASKAYTRLLRYEDTKETQLVLFDHKRSPIHSQESDPRHVLMFAGTKFWAVTRGVFGTGTIHGVHSKQSWFDASLHRDRDCMTVHWISRSDTVGHRLAIVTFVHCTLYPEDVEWFARHIDCLEIDPLLYRL
jgi:hypothetical protein